MKKELTEAQKDFMYEKLKFSYIVVDSYKYSKEPDSDIINFDIDKMRMRCYCEDGRKVYQYTPVCHYCNRLNRTRQILSTPNLLSDLRNHKVLPWQVWHASSYSFYEFYFIEIHPEHNDGLLVHRCKTYLSIDDNGTVIDGIDCLFTVEIIPGVLCNAVKHNKTRDTYVDVLKALNLTSRTKDAKVYFDGYDDALDFMLGNPEMAKHTGLIDCYNKVKFDSDGAILFYLAIYAKYPAIELLIKMKNFNLVKRILRDSIVGYNSDYIKSRINRLKFLINPEATKGSLSLSIPKYIGDYLNENEADLACYEHWCSIYQLDKSLNKENFDKIRKTDEFAVLTSCLVYSALLEEISTCMQYGYKFSELLLFIGKKVKNKYSDSEYTDLVRDLLDYNRICDLMNVKAQKFPKDIKAVHDNIVKAYRMKENEINDSAIKSVAERYSSIAERLNKSNVVGLQIVLPKNSQDLIDEGTQQHNCVGTYIDRVANQQSVVFFIRKTDEPETSYVTGEYRNSKLNQLYYRYNSWVTDSKIVKLANDFCSAALRQDSNLDNI